MDHRLKCKGKTMRLLEEKKGKDWVLGLGNEFLDLTSKAQSIKGKINKLILFSVKVSIKRVKRQTVNWEKVFANYTSNKRLVSRIYKEFSKLNGKKQKKNPLRKQAKDMNRYYPEDYIQMTSKLMKRC